MNELPLPSERHHLDCALALAAYARQHGEAPERARADVNRVFGLGAGLNDDLLCYAMLLLAAGRLVDARAVLTQVALGDPDKFPAAYGVLAAVFKYFNAGLPIAELAGFAIDAMLQIYQTYPQRPDVQSAMLDMLLYLGLPNECEQVLSQADPGQFAVERAELAAYRARLNEARGDCRLSVVLLTYRRPALLRHTLHALREALAETDVELVVGVNDDWPETREVLRQEGVNRVLINTANTGIEFYKQLFDAARGEFLIEIDDDVAHFPAGFDRQIIDCLSARSDLGLVGHWPVGFVDVQSGAAIPPAPALHAMDSVIGLPFGFGPVAGACAGLRRRDFLSINGFSRGALSHVSGEEPQLIRKLALHGKLSGVIFDQGLQVYQNG
ncbi:MAG: glycosyltransferase family 2 protein [Paludibacterium sp.]|uniref:glycosyltransferase family A protein n=1 Tax=Paludibacterium sp. TaxID=1917523 RepID=UPI0025CBA76D|nr:glycosyltransferase family A protein [Paludibacterium sp.]MBV8047357.1 glycosyltransferase family 2 protein [Paludibacterium sp.]